MDSVEAREMTVNITPLHDRVLVRRLEEKETAKGGIIIPDTAKEKPHEGEVMAIGAGKIEKGHRIPLDVKVGDRILFGKYTGNDINIDDQEYLILREEEILLVVDVDVVASVFAEQDPVTDLHIEWDAMTFFNLAGSYGHDLALMRFFFRRIGDYDPALRGFFLF